VLAFLAVCAAVVLGASSAQAADKGSQAPSTLGRKELVRVVAPDSGISEEAFARIDTGAARSSIDTDLAEKLGLDLDSAEKITVKSSLGVERRPIVRVTLQIDGRSIPTRVTVNDRSLTLDAAIKLIEGLPPESRIGRRWPKIWIEPDPFVEADGPSLPPSSGDLQRRRVEHGAQAEMLGRLAQGVRRQDEAEAAAAAQRAPWWRKLVGRRD
jgi:hypothetical protein